MAASHCRRSCAINVTKRDTSPETALARFTVYKKTQIQTGQMCSVDRKEPRRLNCSKKQKSMGSLLTLEPPKVSFDTLRMTFFS